MDDLIIFLIALLRNDPTIITLFTSANSSASTGVVAPQQRTAAAYPRIIIYGDDGKQQEYGDNLPKFFDGNVKIEVVTRLNPPYTPDALALRNAFKDRITTLMLGNPFSVPAIPAVRGQQVSANYRVDRFYQCDPTGRLPTTEATFERWGATYDVLLNRIGWS